MSLEQYAYEEDNLIGKYRVVKQLRPGDESQVYQCVHVQSKRTKGAILKIFMGEKRDRAAEIYGIYKDLEEHENLPDVEEYTKIGEYGVIIFPITKDNDTKHKDFSTLRDLIRNHPNGVPVDDSSLDIIRQISHVIDDLHNQGYIHGKIEPGSILLTAESVDNEDRYHVLLIDFDEAIDVDQPNGGDSNGVSKLSKSFDYRSLGKVVYEMYVGQLPDDGRYEEQLNLIIEDSEVTSQYAMLSKISDVLLQMLAIDPEENFKSASAFHETLQEKSEEFIKDFKSYKKAKAMVLDDRYKWHGAREQIETLSADFKESYKQQIQWITSRATNRSIEEYNENIKAKEWARARSNLKSVLEDRPDDAAATMLLSRIVLLAEASAAFEREEFAECIEKLEELEKKDGEYEAEYQVTRREEAIGCLVEQTNTLLNQGKLEAGKSNIQALAAAEGANSPVLKDLNRRVDVVQELHDYYSQASSSLNKDDFEEAAQQCKKIMHLQEEAGDHDFINEKLDQMLPDVTNGLYDQAANGLAEADPQPEKSIDLLDLIWDLDPEFDDKLETRKDALEAIRIRDNRKRNRYAAFAVTLVGSLLMAVGAIWYAGRTTANAIASGNEIANSNAATATKQESLVSETLSAFEADIMFMENEKATAEGSVAVLKEEANALSASRDQVKVTRDFFKEELTRVVEEANADASATAAEIVLSNAILDQTRVYVAATLEPSYATAEYYRTHLPISVGIEGATWWRKIKPNRTHYEPTRFFLPSDEIEAIGIAEDGQGRRYYYVKVVREGNTEADYGWMEMTKARISTESTTALPPAHTVTPQN
jgi:serine/threonine protein kinase